MPPITFVGCAYFKYFSTLCSSLALTLLTSNDIKGKYSPIFENSHDNKANAPDIIIEITGFSSMTDNIGAEIPISV